MHEEGEPRPDHGVGPGLTHASFFSGVGGLDLGLERGGWETVVFHEIDAYASAVLGTHWPAIPNGGCIYQALGAPLHVHGEKYECLDNGVKTVWPGLLEGGDGGGGSWSGADLFTGGFPCQDLSIAGKRKGLAGHRSGLAYAFLALVERHQPRALLLENVPGLLSSHRGRDLGALLRLMGELGYGVAYRVLDARYLGVPQRRKRVFILGLRSGPDDPDGRAAAERAAAVLAVGTRCPWHPPTGTEAGPVPPGRPGGGPERYGVDYVGAWQAGPHGHHGYDQASVQGHLPVVSHALTAQHTTGRLDPNGETFVVANTVTTDGSTVDRADDPVNAIVTNRAPADPGGDGAPDGLARRLDDRARLEGAVGGGQAIPISGDALRGEGSAGTPSRDAAGRVRLRDPGLDIGEPGDPAFTVSATEPGAVLAHSVQASAGHHGHSSPRGDGSDNLVVSPTLAAPAVKEGGRRDKVPVVVQKPFVKISRARAVDGDGERWDEENLAPTLNTFDMGDSRAVTLITALDQRGGGADDNEAQGNQLVVAGTIREHVRPGSNTDHSVITPLAAESVADPLLPEGLDSHRYRCCGNGVVTPVAEWIGARLAAELRS